MLEPSFNLVWGIPSFLKNMMLRKVVNCHDPFSLEIEFSKCLDITE